MNSDNPNVRDAAIAASHSRIETPSAVPQAQNKDNYPKRKETTQEMRDRLYYYISRPADHSDLPQNQQFLSQVVAYDLPIGYCNIGDNPGQMERLRQLADWTRIESDSYFKSGTLAPVPMPDIILTESSILDLSSPDGKKQEKQG